MSVSVVLPAYQAERYVSEAIDSVLAQSLVEWELLVIDDGSTDATASIASDYASRDPRIRVISRENRGAAATTQEGLELARHEYVAIMHADDRMLPQRLERQRDFLTRNPDVAAASSYVWYVGESGRRIGSYRSTATTRDAARMRFERDGLLAVHHPATMLRRSCAMAVGGYRKAFRVTEDADLFSRLMQAGYAVLVQPEFLLEYRIHGSSASVTAQRAMRREVRWVAACTRARAAGHPEPTFDEHLEHERSRPWRERWATGLRDEAQVHYKAATYAAAQGRYLRAAWEIAASTFLWPAYAPRQVLRKWRGRRGVSPG